MRAEEAVRGICSQLLEGPPVADYEDGSWLVRTIRDRSDEHLEALADLLSELKHEPSTIQSAIGAGVGKTLGFVRRALPSQDLARALRDAYVALNYAAAGYHVLHTHGALLKQTATADLAIRHLRGYTPAIRRLSHLLVWGAAHDRPTEDPPRASELQGIVQGLFESWSADVPLEGQAASSGEERRPGC
jgi:hypothetical protein